jgi:hypothetical protein
MSNIKQQLRELSEKNFIFVPNTYNFLLSTLDILNKNNIDLLLPSKYMIKNHIKNFRDLFIHWNCDQNTLRKLDTPKFYKSKIKKFIEDKNQRFIVFPLILHDKLKCSEKLQTSKITHTNIIIYDKLNKSLERFDPSNTIYYESEMIETVLFNTFENDFGLEIKNIYKPTSICLQQKGIQGLQEDEVYTNKIKAILGGNIGFCSMYSLLYLDSRLSHPNKEPSEIINMIIKKAQTKGISLTKMIVEYTYNLQKIQKEITKDLEHKDQINIIYEYEEEEKKLKKSGISQEEIDYILLYKFKKQNIQILETIFSSIENYFNLKRN